MCSLASNVSSGSWDFNSRRKFIFDIFQGLLSEKESFKLKKICTLKFVFFFSLQTEMSE